MLVRKRTQNTQALATQSLRILLVTNSDGDGVLIRHLLSQIKTTHYLLIRAESPKEAMAMIARKECDLVLLNYFWDSFKIGGRFVKKAKSLNPALPIIVYSAELEPIVEQQIIGHGAADYFTLNELNTRLLNRSLRFAMQRQSKEKVLANLSNVDYLTELPNRRLLQDRLGQILHSAEREHFQFALLLIDINNFKSINDNYGHEVGDELLKVIAQRLQHTIRRNDTAARVGDDEFMLLLSKVVSQELTQQVVYKIVKALERPANIQGHLLCVKCSIGIAIYPEAGFDSESLQQNVNVAMLNAKREKGSAFFFYNPTLYKHIPSQDDLNHDFISALANNQIGIYFNPRIECATDRIYGIEVNPYWEHPEKGLLEYDSFDWRHLDPSMSSRFIEWLLVTSLEYFNQLAVVPETKLIFNIDYQDLLFPSFSQMVSSKLKRYDIKGHQIEFDISNMVDTHHSHSLLTLCVTDLERLGIRFGMNHFGVNNLPLLSLDTIPIEILKLDGRFAENLQQQKNQPMVKAFVDFAHQLNMKIAIEGKHNELPIKLIRELGFDYYKSIFYVEMESLAEMKTLLKTPPDFLERVVH